MYEADRIKSLSANCLGYVAIDLSHKCRKNQILYRLSPFAANKVPNVCLNVRELHGTPAARLIRRNVLEK